MVLSSSLDAYLIHPARAPGQWALVRFGQCESVRHGGPNLEVAEAHPLFGRDTEPGVLYQVMGSPWLREHEAVNATHQQHDPRHWQAVKHYLCFLWDSSFECLARSLQGETFAGDLRDVIDRAARQIHVAR